MIPLLVSVKAESMGGGTEKRDYRNLLQNYGGLDGSYIVIYFTGAVRNENTTFPRITW
jgi:hypothetical protein